MALRWLEDHATVVNQTSKRGILQGLAVSITENGANTDWKLAYPSDCTSIEDVFTLTHIAGDKTVYIEFYRPPTFKDANGNEKKNYHFMEIRYGTGYTAPTDVKSAGTWGDDTGSVRARWSWFRTNTKANIKGWLPIKYWISATSDSLAIVLEGSPSASPTDRLMSFGYFGLLDPFSEDVHTSASSNFGVCVSSDISPFDYLTDDEINQYSDNTATGVTDISMIETSDGFPMQSHLASFTTPDEFTNRSVEGPSAYTKMYHMTYIYAFHNFDGYRGRFKNAIAYDRSTVVNQDNLRHKYVKESDPKQPLVTDRYKVFLVNAPYSIFNNADNVMFGVALLESTDYDVNLALDPGALNLEVLGTGTFNAIYTNSTTGEKFNATNESTWTIDSHNTTITIDKGLVAHVDTPGMYEVTATYGGLKASGVVTVREPYPVSLEITPSQQSIWQGASATYKVKVTMSNGSVYDVTKDCSMLLPDPNHTGISLNTGIVTNTDTSGNYSLSAEYKGLTASATLEVKEVTCTSITITPQTLTVEQGASADYKATANMSDGSTRDLNELGSWSVTGTGTDITIDKGSIANDQTIGTYTITVTFKDKQATASLTVIEKFVPYLQITPDLNDILIGLTAKYTAKYWSTKTTSTDVTSSATWSTSGGDTIDKGVVTGTSAGEFVVTCTYQGADDTAQLKVHDFEFQCIMTWDSGDWDLHGRVYDSSGNLVTDLLDKKNSPLDPVGEIWYSGNSKRGVNANGGVWLDKDNTEGGMEIMSVEGQPGAYIEFAVTRFDDATEVSYPCECKLVNKQGTVLLTKSITQSTALPLTDSEGKPYTKLFKLDLGTKTATML